MHLRLSYEAYKTLNRSRVWGQGHPQPIVYSEILKYADEWAVLNEDQRESLVYFVQELDATFREYVREQQEREDAARKSAK